MSKMSEDRIPVWKDCLDPTHSLGRRDYRAGGWVKRSDIVAVVRDVLDPAGPQFDNIEQGFCHAVLEVLAQVAIHAMKDPDGRQAGGMLLAMVRSCTGGANGTKETTIAEELEDVGMNANRTRDLPDPFREAVRRLVDGLECNLFAKDWQEWCGEARQRFSEVRKHLGDAK